MESNRIVMLYDKAKDIESWGRSMGFDTKVEMKVNVGDESVHVALSAILSDTSKRNERGY